MCSQSALAETFTKHRIPVEEAVGKTLLHDITKIVPGKFKGSAFKKGHVLREQDVPLLLELGKEHIYAFDLPADYLHENEAALRIATAAMGPGLRLSDISEGRLNLVATREGLLKINTVHLQRLNALGDITFATLHTHTRVSAGQPVAGVRVVPLVIEEKKIQAAEAYCPTANPLVQVKEFRFHRIGLITTGSEVFHGRIKDSFSPVVTRKFEELGSSVFKQFYVSDDVVMTVDAMERLIADGAEMLVLTGGMSVDPDDLTPTAIRAAGADVVTYGAPAFPGAMFMLAYLEDVPVVGLPGCVMYHNATIFELVIPRLLSGESVSREDITALGHGGYCAECRECRYPKCGFGKG